MSKKIIAILISLLLQFNIYTQPKVRVSIQGIPVNYCAFEPDSTEFQYTFFAVMTGIIFVGGMSLIYFNLTKESK